MYVVCADSEAIQTYSADTLSRLREDISVEGMTNPSDIVSCRRDRQLYVAEWSKPSCIWRVSTDDHSHERWLTIESTTDKSFEIWSLSMNSPRLLVTSPPRSLRQYNTKDKELLRVVELPQFVKTLLHSIETTRDTFVVCHERSHEGTSQDERQFAVSERFRFMSLFAKKTLFLLSSSVTQKINQRENIRRTRMPSNQRPIPPANACISLLTHSHSAHACQSHGNTMP